MSGRIKSKYLQEKGSNEKALALTVAYLAVVDTECSIVQSFFSSRINNRLQSRIYQLPVCFADPEQGLLPRPPSLFEKLVCWERSVDVTKYHLEYQPILIVSFKIHPCPNKITFSSGVSLVTRMR